MEEFFEPWLRQKRVSRVLPFIESGSVVCDVGCGRIPNFLVSVSSLISKGFGFDKKVDLTGVLPENVIVKSLKLSDELPVESNYFDVVTMLAVLEHLSNPLKILRECYRVLKTNGKLIITIPNNFSKPVLELLSFFHLVCPDEISDHKNYFNKEQILSILKRVGFKISYFKFFNFFFNFLIVCEKKC